MSCDLTCPLSLGIHGEMGTKSNTETELCSKDSSIPFGNDELVRCWFDGKARHMFIITPRAHVSALRDLSDEQLIALFQTAINLLESEGLPDFVNIIVNHGNYMNHSHLHLKINLSSNFVKIQKNWSRERQVQWSSLVTFNKPSKFDIEKKAPKHNVIFITGLDHGVVGVPLIVKELSSYGDIKRVIPFKGRDVLKVEFMNREGAVRCLCDGYGKVIGGDQCPQFKWSRDG